MAALANHPTTCTNPSKAVPRAGSIGFMTGNNLNKLIITTPKINLFNQPITPSAFFPIVFPTPLAAPFNPSLNFSFALLFFFSFSFLSFFFLISSNARLPFKIVLTSINLLAITLIFCTDSCENVFALEARGKSFLVSIFDIIY